MGLVGGVIFLDKFIGNIGKVDARICIAVERSVQVEVADIESGEACIRTRDNTV